MIKNSYPVNSPLGRYITSIWYFEHSFDQKVEVPFLPKPGNFITICLDTLPFIEFKEGDGKITAPISLNGFVDSTSAKISIEGKLRIVGLDLHPYAFFSLTGETGDTFTNEHLDIAHFIDEEKVEELVYTLKLASSTHEIFCITERFFLSHFMQQSSCSHLISPIEKAVNITAKAPHWAIHQLSREIAMSTRSFQRLFKQVAGITPKGWMDRIKYNMILHELITGKWTHMTDCIVAHQFTDLSHLNRFFKKYGEMTPRQLSRSHSEIESKMLNYS
ncbi:helix-turn-helix transcriptional regulator [Fulvivirga ligni]|uniref:helix-turn-helix transcriptional regulator n=1 Tax=Fulvivirga ligni TaxID=2904246 RepID=UPI001F3A14B1|nr:helix-turn-helix transcriptional regulator [Fulvivirga ligni]UII22249.1 helix-turn-helix transcriptional regulator [Fulvivirga ligni]